MEYPPEITPSGDLPPGEQVTLRFVGKLAVLSVPSGPPMLAPVASLFASPLRAGVSRSADGRN